jgi:hypothetical protein
LGNEETDRDAVIHNACSNRLSILNLKPAERRRSVKRLLADDETRKLSDRQIAARTGASHTTVQNIRREMGADTSERVFVHKSGVETTMDTSGLKKVKTAAAGGGVPCSTAHELPEGIRSAYWTLVEEIAKGSKLESDWVSRNVPDTPAEANRLLAQRDAEAGDGEPMKF